VHPFSIMLTSGECQTRKKERKENLALLQEGFGLPLLFKMAKGGGWNAMAMLERWVSARGNRSERKKEKKEKNTGCPRVVDSTRRAQIPNIKKKKKRKGKKKRRKSLSKPFPKQSRRSVPSGWRKEKTTQNAHLQLLAHARRFK